jgi:hypothetical protein
MAYWNVGSSTLIPDASLGTNTIRFRSGASTTIQISDVSGALNAFPIETNLRIEIDGGIRQVESNAFFNVRGIVEVYFLPNSDITLGGAIFSSTAYLKFVDLSSTGITTIPTSCFELSGDPSGLTVLLPPSLLVLESKSFNRSTITSLLIPEGVTTVGDEAFTNCKKLTSIVFPSTLNVMANNIFNGNNSSMRTVDMSKSTLITQIPDQFFEGMGSDPNGIVIHLPPTITTIGTRAFRYSRIRNFVVPEGVTSMGSEVFTYSYLLQSLVLPSTLHTIGTSIFNDGTDKISTISLPKTVLDTILLQPFGLPFGAEQFVHFYDNPYVQVRNNGNFDSIETLPPGSEILVPITQDYDLIRLGLEYILSTGNIPVTMPLPSGDMYIDIETGLFTYDFSKRSNTTTNFIIRIRDMLDETRIAALETLMMNATGRDYRLVMGDFVAALPLWIKNDLFELSTLVDISPMVPEEPVPY